MHTPKPPKKSEMLEVRLSYEDKQNLQKKAQKEGKSVSKLVRTLISEYLNASPPHSLQQVVMETVILGQIKVRSFLIAVGFIISGALVIAPLSSADEIGLKLQGVILQPEGEGTRTRAFETNLIIDEGETMSINLDGNKLNVTDDKGDFHITISAREIVDGLFLELKLMNTVDGKTKIIAEPKMLMKLDGKASIGVGVKGQEEYNLTITHLK